MKRWRVGALFGALVLLTGANAAHAAPKKKAPKVAQEAPQSAEIAKSMGALKWGMSRAEVLEHFTGAIKEKYKPLLAKAGGAIEEDKLRAQMRDELSRVKSSVVDFNGKKTGADAGFLKGEFTHHNGESMLKVRDASSENYYFFIQDKLWKWYKAFDAAAFEGKSFDQFAEAIQQRFGKAQRREGEAPHGGGKQAWLEWQDPSTRLRAVDNKQFYGFYCLVFEDKSTLQKLPQLRTVKPDPERSGNALVESVTSGGDSEQDRNPDIVDRITGKIRHRQDGPDAGGKKGGDAKKPPPPPEPAGGVSKDDDPLKGLGL